MKLIKIYGLLTLVTFVGFLVTSSMLGNGPNPDKIKTYKKGKILPIEEWEKAIVGQWEVDFKLKNLKNTTVVRGISSFASDSIFFDKLEYKYYEGLVGKVKEENSSLAQSGKINRSGTYSIRDSILDRSVKVRKGEYPCYEMTNLEHSVPTNKLNACYRIGDVLAFYGDLEYMGIKQVELLKFTKNEIIIKVNDDRIMEPVIVTHKRLPD